MTGPDLAVTAEFILRLRARGIRDLAVLRAMEAVPRDFFVPSRYAGLAAKDVAVPLPCGQTMAEPVVLARMLEALAATPTCRVLEVGSGSGYGTAILARLGRHVLAVERFRTLALHAKSRLQALGVSNAAVVWGDGLAVPQDAGPFDRILVHAEIETVPPELETLLAAGGFVIATRRGRAEQGGSLCLFRSGEAEGRTSDTPLPGASGLRPLLDGSSLCL